MDANWSWDITHQEMLDKLEHVELDDSWVDLLPEGSSIISATGHGASHWSQSGKIDVRLENGDLDTYFIKLSRGEVGRVMLKGEYESTVALYSFAPEIVPKPIGTGTYETDEDMHFYLCQFIDMNDELPDIVDFCQSVADLHVRSMEQNPDQKFGFHIVTCNGKVPQYVTWHTSWEAFFIESLKQQFELEEQIQGPSETIAELLPAIYEKVCPRLLRPLETEGRSIQPCLVHGDLWDGNIGVDSRTGQPFIFDASAFWAHNEYEHHIWRGVRYKIGKPFRREYFNHFPISQPEDDWDDRNLLYSVLADLHDSILYPKTKAFRELIIESLKKLVEKFPNGYQGKAARKDSEEEIKQASGEEQPDTTAPGVEQTEATASVEGAPKSDNIETTQRDPQEAQKENETKVLENGLEVSQESNAA